jgi:transcriptional regulator with XRE-family HTH domain
MGRGSRQRPKKLGRKLAKIRKHLGFSQDGIVKQLGMGSKITRNDISKYERGLREPSIVVLLKYARLAGTSLESLVDDELKLSMPQAAKPQK